MLNFLMNIFAAGVAAALATGMIVSSPHINVFGVLFVLFVSSLIGFATWLILNVTVPSD